MSDRISIANLRLLADAANDSEPGCWYDDNALDLETIHDARFVEACSPQVVTGLVRYIEELEYALRNAVTMATGAGHRVPAQQWSDLLRKGPVK